MSLKYSLSLDIDNMGKKKKCKRVIKLTIYDSHFLNIDQLEISAAALKVTLKAFDDFKNKQQKCMK